MRKVIHLVPAMSEGGVETVVCELNAALVSAGWESVVISSGGRLVERIVASGGRHVEFDVKSKNPLSALTRALGLRRLLRRENPDLVCAHSRVPAWLYRLAAPGIPWITYAHGANSVSAYSAVMTKGDLTVTPSRFLADFLKAHYGLAESRTRVIHPAVDTRRFDPANVDFGFVREKRREWGIGEDDFVVMSVGRLTPLKGYDTLIKSLPEGMKLVIIGGGDTRHLEYETELRALAEGKDVVFAGYQSKIPECLSIASVVVSANTVKPESFGLSMAEALAMDKPVVAKAFGGALEIVRDGADGVLVGEDNDFGAALRAARAKRFTGMRIGAIKRFSAEEFLARTLSAYGETAR